MAAARASLLAAKQLGLPREDPEEGIAHDALLHLERIEKALLEERQANQDMRDAVLRHANRLKIVVRGGVVLALLTLALGAFFINRNREAIRVSCTLLANTIIQSGASGQSRKPSTVVARAAAERQKILIEGVRGVLTMAKLRRLNELDHLIARGGGVVAVPRCKEIVSDPGSVKSLVGLAKP